MDLSIIIPTHGRPRKAAACVRQLARQTLEPDRFEVLVGVDGPDQGETEAVAAAAGARINAAVHVFTRKRWQAAVRNDLVERARGHVLLFLNDDVLPEPDCARVHLEEQTRLIEASRPALIVGDSPWRRFEPETLFDLIVRRTSIIFFYDQMPGSSSWAEARGEPGTPDPDHDWGFRHAWLLNLSCPAEQFRRAGGLTVFEGTYGFEDDELAYRLGARYGMPVLFRPGARVEHDHRVTPGGYLEREAMLGRSAWGFARAAPDCARAMFGRDVTSAEEIAYCRAFVAREARDAARLREPFMSTGRIPASSLAPACAGQMITLTYQQHIPLKRWTWRRALLEAAGELPGA